VCVRRAVCAEQNLSFASISMKKAKKQKSKKAKKKTSPRPKTMIFSRGRPGRVRRQRERKK